LVELKILQDIKHLSRNVKLVCLGELLNDVGSSLVRPALPVLYRMLGATPFQFGLIEGLSTFFGMMGAAPAGELSDRAGRKKLYSAGHAVMGLTRLFLGLISSIWMFLPLRWIYRLGMAVRYASRDPLLAESSTPETMGLTFAVYELSDCVGSFIGPLLPIFVFGLLGQSLRVIRSLFLFSIVPNVIAVALIIGLVAETVKFKKQQEDSVSLATKFRVIMKNRNLQNFTLITCFTTLFTMTVDLELLYLTYGALKADAFFLSIMFTFWTATTALAALPAGRITDRVGRKHALVLSFVFHAMSVGFILLFHFVLKNVFLLPLAFASLGLYDTFLNVSSKTFVADNSSNENRGMVMGLYITLEGVSRRSLAPIIAGFIFSTFSVATPFILGLLASLTTIILLTRRVYEPQQ
jgi:MFS family permease